MTLCVGRRWLLRIWQRLAGLLKQYVHHRGLVLCGEMERLRHPLLYASSKIILQKLPVVSLAALAWS